MRVLHINQQSSGGGAAGVATSLVVDLRLSGVQSELWYFRENKMLEFNKPLFPVLSSLMRNKGFNRIARGIIRRYSRYYGDISNPLFWMAKKRILDWKPDVLHLHNLHGGWVDLKTIQDIADYIPLVITLHDEWLITGHCGFTINCLRWRDACYQCPHLERYALISRDIANSLREGKKDFLQALSKKNVFLVTPSEWLKKRVMDSGLWQGREIEVISNGIHVEHFELNGINKLELRLKHGFSPDEKIGLFIADGGTQNSFKGYDVLESALSALPEHIKFTLLVVGDKINGQRIEQKGNIKEIRLGCLSHEEIRPYFAVANFFIYPTKADNLPLVVLESMAAEVLVVASRVGGIPEIVSSDTGILFESGDDIHLRDIIMQLCEDKLAVQDMVLRAHKRVNAMFSFNQMLQRYMSLYTACHRY